jgi:hypothetical protein
VTSHEFFFSLEVSSEGAPAPLLEDLALQVFRNVGCSSEATAGLAEALERAATETPPGVVRRCDIQVRARDGLLKILVSSNGGRIWEHTVVVPEAAC